MHGRLRLVKVAIIPRFPDYIAGRFGSRPNWSCFMAGKNKPKQSLADQAYALLRQRIVSLEMPPRFRFTEREISEQTGFGAMPVREALDRLNHDALVETIPRRGYRVAGLTLKSVDDFFTVWGAVAPLIEDALRLPLIVAYGTEDSLSQIHRFNRAQQDSFLPVMEDGGCLGYLHMKDALYARPGERDDPIPAWRVRDLPSVEHDADIEDVHAQRLCQWCVIGRPSLFSEETVAFHLEHLKPRDRAQWAESRGSSAGT